METSLSSRCQELQMEHSSISRNNVGHVDASSLPESPRAGEPSELYLVVLRRNQYPSIIYDTSWTRAVPFKEKQHHRTPSESIGNNYSPRAQHLKIQNLQKRPGFPSSMLLAVAASPPAEKRRCTARARVPAARSFNSDEHKPSDRPRLCHSPPLTPDEQLEIMIRQEEETKGREGEPSEKDLERYMYYINTGVPSDMVIAHTMEQMDRIQKLVPDWLLSGSEEVQTLHSQLKEEVLDIYSYSLKKSIVDYILKDSSERQRLSISHVPKPFPRRVIRGPVPWSSSCTEAKSWLTEHLFTVNPMMLHLQDLWLNQ